MVETEPSFSIRGRLVWVDRDDFQVLPVAKLQKSIVSSHAWVLAAGVHPDAEQTLNPLNPSVKRRSGNDQMVKRGLNGCRGVESHCS